MAMNNVGAASPIPKLQIPKQETINDLNLINVFCLLLAII